jgi:hypothetical protein
MAKECGLPEDIAPHFAAVQTFLQPLLDTISTMR